MRQTQRENVIISRGATPVPNKSLCNILFLSLLLINFSGCKKKNTSDLVEGPPPLHPDLHCPEGTHGEGFPPPSGVLVYCVLDGMSGITMKQGPSIEWFETGQQQAIGDYSGNQKAGDWIFWYETGIIEKQGSFINGNPDGHWIEFHPTGMQSAEGYRVNGREKGLWVYWSEGDNIRTEGHWANGQKDGEWTDYSPEGKPLRQRVYRLGRLINQREF
jgi:antitoxin component YwqK of YwqJK toxin-antitoxin module